MDISMVLRALPRVEGNEFVIVGSKAGTNLVNSRKPWCSIREQAGIDFKLSNDPAFVEKLASDFRDAR